MSNTTYKQQPDSSTCGAVCLMCAAADFNIVDIADDFPGGNNSNRRYPMPSKEAEQLIYKVTSKEAARKKVSLPSGIVRAAQKLGLRATVNQLSGKIVPEMLTWLNPQENRALAELNASVTSIDLLPPLNPGQRRLRVIRQVPAKSLLGLNTKLHYILERDDGHCMDPATGGDLSTWSDLNAPPYNYIDAFIYIQLEVASS